MEESKNIGTGYKESHAYLEDILKKCSMMEPRYESPVYTYDMAITSEFAKKLHSSNDVYRNAKSQYKIYEFENGLEVLVNTIEGKNAGVIIANGNIEPLGPAYNGGYFLNVMSPSMLEKLPKTYITFTENEFDSYYPNNPMHVCIHTPQFSYTMGNFHYMSFDEDGRRQYDTSTKEVRSVQNVRFDKLMESESYADYYYAMQVSGIDENGSLNAINDDNFAGIRSQIRKGWAAAKQNSELQKSYEDIYELYGLMEEAGRGERTTQDILEDITQDEINTAMVYVNHVNMQIEENRNKKESERLEEERKQELEHQKEEETRKQEEERKKEEEARKQEEKEKDLAKKRELIAKIREQQEVFLNNKDKKQEQSDYSH